jgi:pSer/pThr/pTyr-binding forkhead associated (FHA) protein
MAVGFSSYVRRFLSDRSAVVSELVNPVLLWEAAPDGKLEEPWLGTETGAHLLRPRRGEPVVFELKKKADKQNAFAMGVTVGRIDSNDIVIEDHSVSRFHAYFQKESRSDGWLLVDAESKNGTWAGPLKLEPNGKARLTDRTKVRFGDIELEFLLPGSILDRFERALRALPRP